MSWAAHHPELYNEITIRGLRDYLLSPRVNGANPIHVTEECVEEYLRDIQSDPPTVIGALVYRGLCAAASKEISEAEGDYFSSYAP